MTASFHRPLHTAHIGPTPPPPRSSVWHIRLEESSCPKRGTSRMESQSVSLRGDKGKEEGVWPQTRGLFLRATRSGKSPLQRARARGLPCTVASHQRQDGRPRAMSRRTMVFRTAPVMTRSSSCLPNGIFLEVNNGQTKRRCEPKESRLRKMGQFCSSCRFIYFNIHLLGERSAGDSLARSKAVFNEVAVHAFCMWRAARFRFYTLFVVMNCETQSF